MADSGAGSIARFRRASAVTSRGRTPGNTDTIQPGGTSRSCISGSTGIGTSAARRPLLHEVTQAAAPPRRAQGLDGRGERLAGRPGLRRAPAARPAMPSRTGNGQRAEHDRPARRRATASTSTRATTSRSALHRRAGVVSDLDPICPCAGAEAARSHRTADGLGDDRAPRAARSSTSRTTSRASSPTRAATLVSQADGIPIHTGGGGFAVRALLKAFDGHIDPEATPSSSTILTRPAAITCPTG